MKIDLITRRTNHTPYDTHYFQINDPEKYTSV